jgi:hypothetical protein
LLNVVIKKKRGHLIEEMKIKLHGKTFFCGYGGQNTCFETNHNKGVYVCQEASRHYCFSWHYGVDKATRTYGQFPNWNKMWEYNDSFSGRHHLYELIKGNRNRVEHYDLEITFDKNDKKPSWNRYGNNENLLYVEFIDARNQFFNNSKWNLKNATEIDYVTTSSHKNGEKVSFHMVVRSLINQSEMCFEECKIEKRCMLEFKRFLKINYPLVHDCVDFGIYSSNRLFRILGSSKYGTDRIFVKFFLNLDRNMYLVSFINKDRILIEREDNDDLLFVPEVDKKKEPHLQSDHHDQIKNEMNQLPFFFDENIDFEPPIDTGEVDFPEFLGSFPRIQEIVLSYTKDNFIPVFTPQNNCFLLKRNNPSWCPMCYVVHDKIDQYFSLWKGTVSLGCWRSIDHAGPEHLFLGRYRPLVSQEKKLGVEWETYDYSIDWVKDFSFVGNLLIRAQVGKGKTSRLEEFIEANPHSSFLILCPRRIFSIDICRRFQKFGFFSYLDILKDKKLKIKEFRRLSIQVESLHLINGTKYDFCILDECESIISQLFSFETHQLNLMKNHDVFLDLVRNTRCIFMDAFVTDRSISLVNSLPLETKKLWYKSNLEKRKAVEYPSWTELVRSISLDLKHKNKIYFFCSSRKKLIDAHEKLKEKFKILCYHSEGEKLHDNVNEVWDKVDAVFTTSVITVGLNFDKKNVFYRTYVYMSSSSKNVVRDCFQSIARVRHTISNELRFFLDARNWSFPDKFDWSIEKRINRTEDRLSFILGKEHVEKIEPIIKELYIGTCIEKAMSITDLVSEFDGYLEQCNYTKEVSQVVVDPSYEVLSVTKSAGIFNKIDDMNFGEYEEMVKRSKYEGITSTEQVQLMKFRFIHSYTRRIDDQVQEIWDLFCGFGNEQRFANLRMEAKLIDEEKMDIGSTVNAFNNDNVPQVRRIIFLYKCLGVKDRRTKIIKRNKFQKVVDKIKPQQEMIRNAFPINKRIKKDKEGKKVEVEFDIRECIHLLNAVFSWWGFVQVFPDSRKRSRVDGSVQDVADIVVDFPHVYEYFKLESEEDDE